MRELYFKIVCLTCNSENVGVDCQDYGEDGTAYSLHCYVCGSDYESFFGEFKKGEMKVAK